MRRGLDTAARGRRIEAVAMLWRPFIHASDAAVDADITGHRITGVHRRGKVLIVDLDREQHLLLHLKMTGQVVIHRRGQLLFTGGHPTPSILGPMPNVTTRAVFTLTGHTTVFVNDSRKFGWMRVATTAALPTDAFLSRLGPEPLDTAFTRDVLRQQLCRHRLAPIKAALLDQTTIAGLGNIYADECLHVAGIHPQQPTGTLLPAQLQRLHRAIRGVLRDAVEHGGTSFATYVNTTRHRDTYLDHARVFRRQGQPCPVCGTPIERIRVVGRGTNVCPHCQCLSRDVASTQLAQSATI